MCKLVWILVFVAVAFAEAEERPPFITDANKKYHISEVELVYSQAYATCKQYGWTLATEKTADDTAALNAALTAVGTAQSHYLGGYRQSGGDFNPAWIWLEDGQDFDYTNWEDDKESDTYECLVKLDTSTYAGKWSSGSCTAVHYFICENLPK